MTYSSADVIWTLVAAAMVYFMQAGFAMCEAGMTRAKNTGNILMKNMMDFCIGTPIYWLIGFGIMFGTPGRIIDLNHGNQMDLSSVAFLVIDEADRMFDMGFYPDLRTLIKVLPSSEQR